MQFNSTTFLHLFVVFSSAFELIEMLSISVSFHSCSVLSSFSLDERERMKEASVCDF